MDRPYEISIELDTRSTKLDGTHPVKVRVYSKVRDSHEYKKFKRFNTDYSYTSDDWARIWTLKPRKEYLDKKNQLDDKVSEYTKIADRIKPFNLEIFSERVGKGKKKNDGNSEVFDLFETIKSELIKSDSIGTWQCYRDSQNCIQNFQTENHKGNLSFQNINVYWLEEFQKWMLTKKKPYVETSVAIYLRHLRAVINRAIADKIIQSELYPFSKTKRDGKFVIQPGSSKPRALDTDQLKKLMNVQGLTSDQEKAKAFWFFSFASNGMNTKDIALLKWKYFKEDYFTFKRSKIKKTSKKSKEITVYLKPFHYAVIEKYGNPNDGRNEYVFPVINIGMGAMEQDWKINNFIRSINQNIKKVSVKAGLDIPISSVWARHSYATKVMDQDGADPLKLMRNLGHTQFSTTENYIHNLNDKPYRQMQSTVLDDILPNPIKESIAKS